MVRPTKPSLTDEETVLVVALLRRGTYKGSGLRAAANMVSALRGAPTVVVKGRLGAMLAAKRRLCSYEAARLEAFL